MDREQIEFNVLFRNPVYPSKIPEGETVIKAIDSSAEEFWYSPDNFAIAPGFAFKKWTKKQIVELYNSSSNAKKSEEKYPLKSLSNKKLSRIIGDICKLLKS
jgi:ribosomal protein S24E